MTKQSSDTSTIEVYFKKIYTNQEVISCVSFKKLDLGDLWLIQKIKTKFTNLYLEFNNSSFDIGNTHPDPNGIFTGSAFELVSRGYLNLIIITQAGISNFAFKITNEGINLLRIKKI